MIEKLSRALLIIAALALLSAVALVFIDVLHRQLGLGSVAMVRDIITGYLVATMVFLTLPFIQKEQRHIEVEAVYSLLAPGVRAWLRGFVWLISLLLFAGWTAHALIEAIEMQTISERITGEAALTVWPARFIVFAGLAATLLVILVQCPFIGGKHKP